MAWIRTVEPEDAGPELREAYAAIRGTRGKLSNIMQAQSLHPTAMVAHLDLYMAVMFGRSGVTREERELIAVAVSAANQCRYCVAHHSAALQAYWKDEERVRRAAADLRSLELPGRMRAMAEYASVLTRDPSSVREEHIHAMRAEGLVDEDILAVNLVASYFNFVNRIAEGLGVELSPEEVAGYQY